MPESIRKTGLYLLDRYGLPTTLLIVILYWTATRIVSPLIVAHASYLDRTARSIEEIAKAQGAQARTLETQAVTIDRIDRTTEILLTRGRVDRQCGVTIDYGQVLAAQNRGDLPGPLP